VDQDLVEEQVQVDQNLENLVEEVLKKHQLKDNRYKFCHIRRDYFEFE